MKLYIIADMEGVAGVVSSSQTTSTNTDYETARIQYTREVATVCMAALQNGVEEIYVNDFHGNGLGVLADKLPEQVMLIRGDYRQASGYELLDNTFSGLIIIGMHARTGTHNGVLPHTYTPKIKFNLFGQPLGEFDILSLIAGEQKVPTILVSGDSVAIEQAQTNLPSTPMVITKYSTGVGSALCIHPDKVCKMLANETKRAVKSIAQIEPPEISPPALLEIKLNDVMSVDKIKWIPGLKQTDELTFEYAAESMKQIADLIYGVSILV